MKKVLFIILLLLPLFVVAEDVYYSPSSIKMVERFEAGATYYYSDDVIYENGTYRLTGQVIHTSIDSSSYNFGYEIKELYTCHASNSTVNTECENVYVVYKDSTCIYFNNTSGSSTTGRLGIMLRNGMKKEDVEYYYIGNDYKYENGKYTLVDYEKYDIKTIDYTNYLIRQYHKKFFCIDNYGITCDNLYILNDVSDKANYGTPADRYYLISDNYIKENNEYRLVNPRRVWGDVSMGERGYTCRSKDDHCDVLYTVSIADRLILNDGGLKNSFTLLEVTDKTKDLELKLNDAYDLLYFFEESELNNIVNTNPSVADIKNGKLELYSVGETYFIVEDDFNYKALHLKVTENDLSNEEKENEKEKE